MSMYNAMKQQPKEYLDLDFGDEKPQIVETKETGMLNEAHQDFQVKKTDVSQYARFMSGKQ